MNAPRRGRPPNAPVHPTPAMIRAEREASGLSQTEAAARIYCALRTWQDWEAGNRRMHPCFWEAWLAKTRHQRAQRADPSAEPSEPSAGPPAAA